MKLHAGKGVLISIFYASIPLIWKGLISRDDSYNCRKNWMIFAIQWLGMFLYKLFNYLLVVFAVLVVQMKLDFKKQIIATISPTMKYTHKITPVLPELLEASSSNIQ